MEKNKINIAELLLEKEKNINNQNFYFYLGILEFVYYINYFPKLQNEEINRLKYYFNSLYEEISKTNINIIEIITQDKTILENILILLFNEKPAYYISFECLFITFMIVLSSYKQVVNLISKNNVFTKKIEYKIDLIIDSIRNSFEKYISKIKQQKSFTFKDINGMINIVLGNKYCNFLLERQKLRFDNMNLQEYKNKVDIFNFFSDRDGILSNYNKMKTKNRFEYEYNFFRDLPKLIEGIVEMMQNQRITINKN